jgi:hypothetical protein
LVILQPTADGWPLAQTSERFADDGREGSMKKSKHEGNGGVETVAEHLEAGDAEAMEANGEDRGDMVATIATVAVVGVGAAVFEAALLPGIVLGVAAVAVPRYLPQIGAGLSPLFRSTVRGAYRMGQKTKEMFAEAQEQVHDIVAEVDAEKDLDPAASKRPAAASGLDN